MIEDGRAHLPERVPIDAYGNGGFRFGGMSHRGSLLCLPNGMFGWNVTDAHAMTEASFAFILAARDTIGFVLLGTGRSQIFPAPGLRKLFKAQNLPLEVMDTGAAARTYNVLLAERRPVAAALIAVD